MELLIGIIGGGVISWILTHWYYHKANKEVPEWARPLIKQFPDTPPTLDELIDRYHGAVMDGDIVPHPTGFIKCPECGAGVDKFIQWEHYADHLDSMFHGHKCSECNYVLSHQED